MKIAIPTREGVVDDHFGHCAYYTVIETADRKVLTSSTLESPEGCGCKSNIASRMQEMGITVMLAGNIGEGAINKLSSHGITVVKGCKGDVMQLAQDYLDGRVADNPQVCSHHDCHTPTFKMDLKL